MQQRRWLELIKDYYLEILYHPGKANVVADALSRKSVILQRLKHLTPQPKIRQELVEQGIEVWLQRTQGRLCFLEIASSLMNEVKSKQFKDPMFIQLREDITKGKAPGFIIQDDGILRFQGRLCVPNDPDLKQMILSEAHSTPYSIHPGTSKIYEDLKRNFWWSNMRREVEEFISRCLTCQQVKIEHQRPAGMLQLLHIPEWK